MSGRKNFALINIFRTILNLMGDGYRVSVPYVSEHKLQKYLVVELIFSVKRDGQKVQCSMSKCWYAKLTHMQTIQGEKGIYHLEEIRAFI